MTDKEIIDICLVWNPRPHPINTLCTYCTAFKKVIDAKDAKIKDLEAGLGAALTALKLAEPHHTGGHSKVAEAIDRALTSPPIASMKLKLRAYEAAVEFLFYVDVREEELLMNSIHQTSISTNAEEAQKLRRKAIALAKESGIL